MLNDSGGIYQNNVTYVDQAIWNSKGNETVGAVADSGQIPIPLAPSPIIIGSGSNDTDTHQLSKALGIYGAVSNSPVVGGTANALTLTPRGTLRLPSAGDGASGGNVLLSGAIFAIKPILANTGATTVAVAGNPAIPLNSTTGSPLLGGELQVGVVCLIQISDTGTSAILLGNVGALTGGASAYSTATANITAGAAAATQLLPTTTATYGVISSPSNGTFALGASGNYSLSFEGRNNPANNAASQLIVYAISSTDGGTTWTRGGGSIYAGGASTDPVAVTGTFLFNVPTAGTLLRIYAAALGTNNASLEPFTTPALTDPSGTATFSVRSWQLSISLE